MKLSTYIDCVMAVALTVLAVALVGVLGMISYKYLTGGFHLEPLSLSCPEKER